jgi:hypothetical protein
MEVEGGLFRTRKGTNGRGYWRQVRITGGRVWIWPKYTIHMH